MKFILPNSDAALSKPLVYGRSLAGIVGWNPPGSMDVLSDVSVVLSGRGYNKSNSLCTVK